MLRSVSIQFPDPWFKASHMKRRMVNEALVKTLEAHLTPHKGFVFLKYDIKEMIDAGMRCFAEGDGRFHLIDQPLRISQESAAFIQAKSQIEELEKMILTQTRRQKACPEAWFAVYGFY